MNWASEKHQSTKSWMITWGWRFARDGYRNFNVPIESNVVKSFWKNCNQHPTGFFGRTATRYRYTITSHSVNKKQRPGRNQAKRHQPDHHKSHDRLSRSSWPSSEIVKVFFSSIFYHMVLHSMVYNTHLRFADYVLLFGRNVARNLGVVCCFFATTYLFTSSTSYKLHRIESSCIFAFVILSKTHRNHIDLKRM